MPGVDFVCIEPQMMFDKIGLSHSQASLWGAIEAKKDDLTKGLTQFAVELIAIATIEEKEIV